MSCDWRSATPDELLAHLDEMDLDAFELALENDGFHEEHVRLLLKRPGLEPAFVERISRESRFFRRGAIRVALVAHPRVPRVRALELVPYLYWRDALRIATNLKVHPQVRVVAEHQVVQRIEELTVGEKTTIARTATRSVLQALRNESDPRVITAVLQNYRCTEEDATFIAANPNTPPHVLAVVARHPKWRQRPQVRAQLVRNRRLGLPIALGLLEHLGQGELHGVVRKKDLPKVLRDSARRLLDEARRASRTRGARA